MKKNEFPTFPKKKKINAHFAHNALTLVILTLGATVLYYWAATRLPPNSDRASLILEASDFLSGNFLLHGWALPPDTFYLLDMLVTAISLVFGRTMLQAMYIVPAILYATLIVATFLISFAAVEFKSRLIPLLAVALFTAFPTGLFATITLQSPIHILTLAVGIYTLYAAALPYPSPLSRATLLAGMTLICSSDPYAIYVFCIPIAILAIYGIVFQDNNARPKGLLLATTVAVIVGKLFPHVMRLLGGYETVEAPLSFVAIDNFPHNLYLFCLSVLEIFQADFFGRRIDSHGGILAIIHLIAALGGLFGCLFFMKNRLFTNLLRERLVALCIIAGTLASCSFLFSTMPVNTTTARYLTILAPLLSIVTAATVFEISNSQKRLRFVINSACAVAASAFLIEFVYANAKEKPVEPTQENLVIGYLKSHKLLYGFAPYWSASLLTAISNDSIKIRPITATPEGAISPFMWLAKNNWFYETKKPRFILYPSDEVNNIYHIDNLIATTTFGPPQAVKEIGNYTILIWLKSLDLAPKIQNFAAATLPSQTGGVTKNSRIAEAGRDKCGFLSYGPYTFINPGAYKAEIFYESKAARTQTVGYAEAYSAERDKTYVRVPLIGTSGGAGNVKLRFATNSDIKDLEVRVWYNGSADLSESAITVTREDQ